MGIQTPSQTPLCFNTGKKGGLCYKKIKRNGALAHLICLNELNINGYLPASTSKYFLVFFVKVEPLHFLIGG
jgi:hypothetical protein